MRHLLATLCLLAAAGAAQAENSITLYGLADVGIQHLTEDRFGAGQTGFQDSPSASNRVGLRGAMSLPRNWTATFNLESRYFLDGNGPSNQYSSNGNVTSRLFDRAANVGLDGPWGSFRAGLINNPVTFAHVAGDIRGPANSGGGIFGWYRNRSIDSTCVDGSCDFTFLRRAVSWRSPQWNGLTGSAFYVFGSGNASATATSSRNNGGFGLAANYAAGPFGANVAAQQMDDQNGRKVGQVTLLNGTWTAGPWVFKAGTTEFRQYAGGVLYRLNSAVNPAPFGTVPSVDQANRLHNVGVGYRWGQDWWLTAAAYQYRRKGDATHAIDLYTLGAEYAINKHLTAYTIASHVKNGSAANQSAGFYALTTTPGASNSALTVGLRATFDLGWKF